MDVNLILLVFMAVAAGQDTNMTISNTNLTSPFLNDSDTQNSSESSTELPVSTTSSSADPPNDEFTDFSHEDQDFCVCDLHLNWCDINCCCDDDCHYRDAFSHCIETKKQIHDSRYCSHRTVVYINNAETKVETSSGGLFCIVWDNTGKRDVFDDPKPITDINKLVNLTAQHNYKWEVENIESDAKSSEPQVVKHNWRMKFGESISVSRDETRVESDWELPFAAVIRDGECNSLKRVEYLNHFQSSCYRSLHNHIKDCQTSGTDDNFLDVDYYYKSLNFSSLGDNKKIYIDPGEAKPLSYNPVKKVCENVVQSVRYTVWHNGSEGIIDINVTFVTVNLETTTKWLKQSFEVVFLWANNFESVELSGHPGYIEGRPLLTAYRAKDMNQTKSDSGFELLDISGGTCDHHSKKSITFGSNTISGCLLRVDEMTDHDICAAIQSNIWQVLGSHPAPNVVGVFGNSSIETHSDWIEVQTIDNKDIDSLKANKCPILLTGVSLYFYYVMTGTATQPQHKIIGAVKTFSSQNEVRVKCEDSQPDCQLFVRLAASVTFIDITHPTRPDYAPPVALKIQLPSDFFYPFLTNSKYSTMGNTTFSVSIVLTALVFYIF